MAIPKALGLLLVVVSIFFLQVLALLDLQSVFEPRLLLPLLNTLFAGIIPIVVAYAAGKSYVKTDSTTILFMGCGMLSFGLCAVVAGWMIRASDGPNLNVTVYNTGALIGSLFHSIGAIFSLGGKTTFQSRGKERLILTTAYFGVAAFVALFSLAALQGFIPPFFVQGVGPTGLRQLVLGNAVFLYGFSSIFLMGHSVQWKSNFLYWYSLSLAMLAIGLFAFFVQRTVGSPIGWFGRTANYLGGLLALIAIFTAMRDARTKHVSLESAIAGLLADAEAGYRSLVETATDAIVTLDNQARIIGWNWSAERMFGYAKEEAVGLPFLEKLIPQEFLGVLQGEIESSIRSGKKPFQGNTVEAGARRKDGSLLPVELSLSARKVSFGWVSTWIIRDISLRKQAEAEIKALNKALEIRVAQRTVELEKANTRLEEEVEERKETEEALKSLLHFRQTLIDSIPNPVFYKDLQGRYIGCNDAFAAVFGMPKEEVVGKTVYEVGPKELANLWRQKDLELLAQPHVQVFEFTMLHPDGTEHTLLNHKAPFFDLDGALVGLIGVMMDVTDLLRAQEAVRQSEERYRTLVEESFDGIFIQKGSKIVFANSRLYEMLGYSKGELEGLDHWRVYAQEYQEITRERAVARMRGEDVEPQYEVKLQRKDGSTFDGEVSARRVTVEDCPGVQVWVKDVSIRKQSEDTERRLATAVEQSAEAIVVTDATGKIQWVNPAFERISGYRREEVIDQNPRLLKSGEHDQAFYEDLWKTIKRGDVWTGRFINKRKDGSLYHEDSTISPVLDSRGTIINFVAVKRDITQQLALSRQLLLAQKMEAVGTLAGGVAHDFNNLLQIILGYSELLLVEKGKDDPEHTDLSRIFQAAKSGAALVQQLLMFSRRVESKPIPLSLNRQIVQVAKLLRRTIPKMIDIQMDLSDDLAEINADPSQMEQVFMNLAVNARDAMSDKGTLTVSTRNITLDEAYCRIHAEARSGEYVLLSVSDTGHGMDAATIEHIFEPFYTTKELGRGTGLGLAIVYGIVKHHNGYITCDSAVGHGTTFEVYFPALESRVEPDLETTGVMPAFGTETILVVDDEAFVRDLGTRILTKAGYKVLTAANGKEALDLLLKESTQISLVILDLIMPEMGGKECLKELRKIDPGLKVIIASGLSADLSTKESRESGARGFVSKPFMMKELLQQVRKVLD
jgi:PAS domain S-box-containing protein